MICSKCGGLAVVVAYGDLWEEHEATKCMVCGWVGWLNPVPFSPPECSQWDCDVSH